VSEKIVTMTRVFSAPREEVFAAWTQAKHLARWFGPTGFTVPSCEVDPRPGGLFRLTLTEQDRKTTLKLHAIASGPTAEAAAMLSGMQKGWSQTVDRLAALLNPHFTPKR
jgi:uncharacterized protein YndB with AHSA1/START domain